MNEPRVQAPLLAGFWSGGFEGADHVNAAGVQLDLVQASGHLDRLEDDHARAAGAGLSSVRESIGWRLSENAAGVIDLSRAQRIAESAQRHGLQVLWTLMHYGLPAGLSLHDDAFIERFARFAAKVVNAVGTQGERAPVFTPINEISFLAWAASQPHLLHDSNGTVGLDDAGVRDRGFAVKCRLVRAALLAMRAMKAAEPRCLFMHVEPLVHVAAPHHRPDLAGKALHVGSWQWQVLDLLTGLELPELGGHPGTVDMMGVNHYHDSQWEIETGLRLEWHLQDPRRQPLSVLLQAAWGRYRKPLMLAETSHVGSGRAAWLHEMAGEVRLARARSVPVEGFCLYPLTDRPDWNEGAHWHRSGLWHVAQSVPEMPCTLVGRYGAALKSWQQYLPNAPMHDLPLLVVLCHRRWGTKAHRTQQLVQQLANRWRVLWVEDPIPWDGPPSVEIRAASPTVDVLSARVDADRPGFAHAHLNGLRENICAYLARHAVKASAVWFTTPQALTLARALQPACVVHDSCGPWATDGTAALSSEHALQEADVVFAAGSALTRRLQASCGRTVHRLDNGVDLQHFIGRSHPAPGWRAMEGQALQGHLAHPRVGYAGTIDARVDTRLIARMADARPHWNFVMVGPVVGFDAQALPRRPNITWLGVQPHELMPELMGDWDIGWMPWFDSVQAARAHPTQALEYLACGLAVVTPWISDLVPLVPAGVRWARHVDLHLRQCETVLAQTAAERAEERLVARQLLQQRGWSDAARRAEHWMAAHAAPARPPVARNVSFEVKRQSNVVHKVA